MVPLNTDTAKQGSTPTPSHTHSPLQKASFKHLFTLPSSTFIHYHLVADEFCHYQGMRSKLVLSMESSMEEGQEAGLPGVAGDPWREWSFIPNCLGAARGYWMPER